MNLVRFIYASRFCDKKFDSQELAKINKTSQLNNKESEITGALVFGEDYFLQCLEGSREAVNKTFQRILLDPRHESILIMGMTDIVSREFSEWEMKYIFLTEKNSQAIREFSTSAQFNPFCMPYNRVLELLKALSK